MICKMEKSVRKFAKFLSVSTALAIGFLLSPSIVYAQYSDKDSYNIEKGESTVAAPPEIGVLYNIEVDEDGSPIKEGEGVSLDIRLEAMEEAALSYGARGGLAFRTYEIRQELDQRARYLDKVFNFRQLLIKAPSGFLIEPPVISEAQNNVIVDGGGLEAAVADRMLNINTNAKIVTAPKTWRQYLEREWGEVEPPPNVLRPVTDEERELWVENVSKGWVEGHAQAEDIFSSDLDMLLAHFRGMVRYRVLLAQGMVSPTLAVQTDRGITGGGNQMRIGDRAVQIVDIPQLIPESAEWSPENQ
jgi:defect-in-organelle-trafficking protein DotC